MTRRVLVAGLAALLAASLVSPAGAQPVRDFAPPIALSASGIDVYGSPLAVLADGTVGVAWTEGVKTIHMAVRKPGATTFTELTPLTLEGSQFVLPPPVPSQWPAVTLLAAGSEFLLGWGEQGPLIRARASRVTATATAIPAPVTVSGTDTVNSSSAVVFGTATDGSAAVSWLRSGVLGLEVRVARRAGTTGGWEQLGTAGRTTFTYDLVAAIDTTRSVTVGWTDPGSTLETRVRSYQAGGWGLTVVAGAVDTALLGVVRSLAAASSGTATVVAFSDALPGTLSRGIRLLQRPSSTAGWTVSSARTGPGRVAVAPSVVMAPDGSAVLTFFDLGPGDTPAVTSQLTTLVAQRRGPSGALGPAQVVAATAVRASDAEAAVRGRLSPALAPDGTLVIPTPVPVAGSPGTVDGAVGTVWRPSWTGLPVEQAAATTAPAPYPVVGLGLDPAGRATIAYIRGPAPTVMVTTTALPTPFVRSRAALSTTAPKVGTAVTCTSAWTGAKTLAFRWLRGSSVISGATAKTYTPKAADAGRALSCRATATNPTGSTASTSVARTVG